MTPEQFREARIELRFSQSKMAEFLGLSNSRIIRYYESGDVKIPRFVEIILELHRKNKELRSP